ncbi:MAG TPA: hypothetical protein VGP08_06135 [Pyrinomonadaceae bacterium]|jgi:prefoldin subunit 5|nr:hypothetical protein [Pyrinomonadaceae bacterium]
MTNEEVERAIDFLLRSQANSEARIEQTNQQLNRLTEGLDELRGQMGAYADTQMELMRVLTRSIEEGERFRESQKRVNGSLVQVNEALAKSQARAEESQARVNETLSAGQARAEESQARINESLRESISELAAKQSKTEEALARLADAQAQSERRMGALTKIVEEERGRR